jgi:hypothetical protein
VKAVLAALLAACAHGGSPPPHDVQLAGTLENGMTGIGGEHTGVVLHVAGQADVELAIAPALVARMQELDRKPVRVSGRFETVHGEETGDRQVLIVTTLAPGP